MIRDVFDPFVLAGSGLNLQPAYRLREENSEEA